MGAVRWLLSDLRHALRRWRRRPVFALTAILTLALGVCATTSIYSVVDGVLLKPLPWSNADRLVFIHAVEPARLQRPALAATWNRAPIGWREWEALQRSPAFTDVGAWMPYQFLFTGDYPEIVDGAFISSNLLKTLGARPQLGRMFTAEEDRVLAEEVALVSYDAWQRRFGGRDDVIGRVIAIGMSEQSRGHPRKIVGVLPPAFRLQGMAPEFVLPLGLEAYNGNFETNRFLKVVARLASGVTFDAASAAADPPVRGQETRDRRTASLVWLIEEEIAGAARPLWFLLGGSALLLLVACSNVAGLLLGESRSRRHEIAVRTSLGAGVWSVLRQLTVEQMLLCATASAAGVLLAAWLTPALVALAPARLPRLDSVDVDLGVALGAFGVGLAMSMFFAIVPAIALARTPTALVLAEGSRDGTAGRNIGQRVVVVAEFALALVLLVGASLLGETIARLTSLPLGFDPSNVAVIAARVAAKAYSPAEWEHVLAVRNNPSLASASVATYDRDKAIEEVRNQSMRRLNSLLEHLSAVPGVVAAAGVDAAPFVSTPQDIKVRREGAPVADAQPVAWHFVTERYFDVMRLPIVRGRAFGGVDSVVINRVVVSRELERRLFYGNAVGKRLSSAGPGLSINYEVIGVAENAKHREFTDDDRAAMYLLDTTGTRITQYVARTAGDAALALPFIHQALHSSDPQLVVTTSRSMSDLVAASVAEPQFRATLSAVFGLAALVLSAVGLYGLVSCRVAERRREIGVRVALGARPGDVHRLVLRDALGTVGVGLVVGLPAAFAASQVTRTFLYGVEPTAVHVFAITSIVLALAAVCATVIPARRAARIDPMLVLRE